MDYFRHYSAETSRNIYQCELYITLYRTYLYVSYISMNE